MYFKLLLQLLTLFRLTNVKPSVTIEKAICNGPTGSNRLAITFTIWLTFFAWFLF